MVDAMNVTRTRKGSEMKFRINKFGIKENEAFLSKVEKTDYCWFWEGIRLKGHYGLFYFLKKREYAHRAAYRIFKGPIVGGFHVCHSCDTPSCVNPDHLWLGTHSDNMADMKNKNIKSGKNKDKLITARISPELYKLLKKKNIHISKVVRKHLEELVK